jgi:hypothetical protein
VPKIISRYAAFLATTLVVFLFASHASAQKPDALGTVNASTIGCPEGGMPATACYALAVSCPSIQDYTVYLKTFVPTGRTAGVVTLTQGGTASTLYEAYVYGDVTISNLVNAGFLTVEITFGQPFSDEQGWEYAVNGAGVRAASCRYATVTAWIKTQLASRLPLCATGNSAGSALIGEGLAHYNLGQYLAFAELTSGPPFTRVDEACINLTRPSVEYCSGADINTEVGVVDATEFLDPAYPGPWCSEDIIDNSDAHLSQFLNDSITSSDAQLSYFGTNVWFLYGGLDTSAAINQGEIYRQSIRSSTQRNCVADAPHSIPDVLDGAERIASDMIQQCNQGFGRR